MARIILFFSIFIFSLSVSSEELSNKEKIYFDFIDLNKDRNISMDEMNKLINLIFQLIDKDKDGNISEIEIIDLKNIIESLS